MVLCGTCGTEDRFKLVTGFYFCTVCNSQSQHAVEEELELEYDPGGEANRVFTAGRVVGGKQTKRDPCHQRLRSYRRLNLYNDLLRKLVDELIKLGAPPRVKLSVMELWFKYIHLLEADVEPYGKLPPFCLKEEFEMAAKRIKEASFGMKQAVFNHVSMRYRSAYKQRNKDVWYKKHTVLCGYRASKLPRQKATGMSDIVSGLTSTDSSSGLSTPCHEPMTAFVNETSSTENLLEASGFGFGTLDESVCCSGNNTVEKMEVDQDFPELQPSSAEVPAVEMKQESFSFGDTRAALEASMIANPDTMAQVNRELSGGVDAVNSGVADLQGMMSLNVTRDETDIQVESVDLTSTIAYKLKAYMEERDQHSLEHFVEPVFQMHSSCLIIFLYLGLVRAKVCHIGILDLYRFVRQKALSYLEAREAVSDDLLKLRRNLFFNMTLPDIDPSHTGMGSFVKSTGLMAAFLQITDLSLPPIEYFVGRIGLDLNLPVEVRGLAVKLCRQYNLQPSWSAAGAEAFPHRAVQAMPLMELEACAVIIFVLKFLFGIDGTSEYSASLEAERRNRDENVRYFVISRWMTQLSRRAHFLWRRGSFYKAYGSSDFEHVQSAAYLLRHEAKRRADFYQVGMVSRRCARLLDDIIIERKFSVPKLSPSSWPMTGALRMFVQETNPTDPLRLLEDMTGDRVLPRETATLPLAARQHARFYVEASRKGPGDPDPTFAENVIAPPVNMISLVDLLSGYCCCNSLQLHRVLLRLETRMAQATV